MTALMLPGASADFPLAPVDGGVGISCFPRPLLAAAAALSAFGGRPTFLGLGSVAPGVATNRALAGAAPLAGLALLPLVVLVIAAAKSELSARRKR